MEQHAIGSPARLGQAFVTFAAILGSVIFVSSANAAGDATRGEILYQGCQDCHSIEKNDVGPLHRGVVGRSSGAMSDYDYSPALRNAKIKWTEDNLDKWLAGPQQFIPGTKMFYEVKKPQDRADLIAFLKERAL